MISTPDNLYKALTSLAIEKTLLNIGKPTYDKVVSRLDKKYHCYIPDCYEHPEYLAGALEELFGNAHKVIVEDIRKELEEFIHKESVRRFIEVICR